MKQRILAANWKMNKTIAESKEFFAEFAKLKPDSRNCRLIFCVPFTALSAVGKECKKIGALAGAENLHPAASGAFTGEISAGMLLDAGARAVIVGHSERRTLFHETDAFINEKVRAGLAAGLTVIFCIGETLKERQSDKTNAVLKRQLAKGLAGVGFSKNLIIAYEPVWAIGTGLVASREQIAAAHAYIKQAAKKQFAGADVPVLYGGSANEKNAAEIFSIENVDGALVGGAALVPGKFAAMIGAAGR
jgi:triosephosphate isomerase